MKRENQIDELITAIYRAKQQIEEMAKDLCGGADCATCGELMPCFSKHFSKRAVEKGYRKASDVAREIFEEIEKAIATLKYTVDSPRYTHIPVETMVEVCNWILQDCIPKRLAELKKKYIGKDTNVTTNTEGCDG